VEKDAGVKRRQSIFCFYVFAIKVEKDAGVKRRQSIMHI
jgi:hypothetical protein